MLHHSENSMSLKEVAGEGEGGGGAGVILQLAMRFTNTILQDCCMLVAS